MSTTSLPEVPSGDRLLHQGTRSTTRPARHLGLSHRQRLFVHQDGFILALLVDALQRKGVLTLLLDHRRLSVAQVARHTSGNPGYLQVALRTLAQQGWLSRTGTPRSSALAYDVTTALEEVRVFLPLYQRLGAFLRSHLPFERSLFERPDPRAVHELGLLVEAAAGGWRVSRFARVCAPADAGGVSHHLDGALIVPLLVALWRRGRLQPPDALGGHGRSEAVAVDLLAHLGWFDRTSSRWTEEGRSARDHALYFGMVTSYIPMLVDLPTLLFGRPDHRTHLDAGQEESHVDRRLNVLASAAAHRKYFEAADEIFLDIFDREPVEAQPTCVVDTGCGDGSWLRHIYELVSTRTRRGRVLAAQPLLMVGADYNRAALEIAKRNLEESSVPCVLLFGDVSDPAGLAADLRRHGVDLARGLNIRSFLDHNRCYRPPTTRGTRGPRCRATGAYVAEDGTPIPAALLYQELVGFLRRWTPYAGVHGLVLLEAHCVDPRVTARHLGDTHNLVFDTYHGFSRQYPVDFEVFMEAASRAGLTPALYHQRRFPSRKPFVAISLNRFIVPGRPRPIPSVPRPREERDGDWRPDGMAGDGDGQALHRLLYQDGRLDAPRAWCAAPTGALLRPALRWLRRRLDLIRSGRAPQVITLADYGAGTGMATLELIRACDETGVLRQLHLLDVKFTVHVLDIPSAWFAQGYELMRECPYVRFHSLLEPGRRRFAALPAILGVAGVDMVIASMVFHLVPRAALARVFGQLAAVLAPDGTLLWNSPDVGPAPDSAVLFHDANRQVRRLVIELIESPEALANVLRALPWRERTRYADLPAALRLVRRQLTREMGARSERIANRQILPVPNDVADIQEASEPWFEGRTYARSFALHLEDALGTLLIPSNQRYVGEIEDPVTRAKMITLLMTHRVFPALRNGAAGTADGVSLHWTFGEHTLKGSHPRSSAMRALP